MPYRWSNYHLRWWIVDQVLRLSGHGFFSIHPSIEVLYYRMLGAHIGNNVRLYDRAILRECDLITLKDGCAVDSALVRGFCVERDGYFRLDRITVGRRAVVNTYTQLAPGANIPDGAVYGPQASSHDDPSHKSSAASNRALFKQPEWYLQLLFAWPLILIVQLVSCTLLLLMVSFQMLLRMSTIDIPWFIVIWLMVQTTFVPRPHLNSVESIIYWFASPQRIGWHALSR